MVLSAETIPLFFTGVTIAFTLVIHTWLIVKYLMERMDTKIENERKAREKSYEDTDMKIAKIKDTHVLREDFHRFVDGVTLQIKEMNTGINSRMDQLFSAIAQGLVNYKGKSE